MQRTKTPRDQAPRGVRNPWLWLFVVFFLLLWRTLWIHLYPDPRVLAQANSQYWVQVPVSTTRGDIRDREGIPLALSIPAVSFFVDPLYWNPANAVRLKPFFDQSVVERLSHPLLGRFQWVARKVDPDRAAQIEKLKLPGLFSLKEKKRVYPHGPMAAHLLGYCDIDDNGLSGLELTWNKTLYSPPQVRLLAHDAQGGMLDILSGVGGFQRIPAGTVKLTIDSRFQQILEWRLQEGVKEVDAKWGAAICMNPQTGEILAMASWPTFDPNDRKTLLREDSIRNNSLGRVYEPGSTLKPIIMGMALDQQLASPRDRFYCSGRVRIADRTISDVHVHGSESLEDVVINSCNIGMGLIGMRFDPHLAYDMLQQFGFGRITGIDLPGEEAGLLKPPEEWWGANPANVAIGQGIGVTPLQLIVGISAIANGGFLLKPYLVAEVKGGSGEVLYQGKRRVRVAVLSPRTSEWLRGAMRKVVTEGTGKSANTPLATVAGKTGTAQIALGGQYAKGQYVASFVGFWPYEDPQFALLVVIGEPHGGRYYGAEVAAPVFKNIVEDIVRLNLQ